MTAPTTPDLDSMSAETRRKVEFAERAAEKEFKADKEITAIMEADGIRAAYKIEVLFGQKRTVQGPNVCLVQLWESGKHFHGGGDALMYVCIDGRKLKASATADIYRGLVKAPEQFEWVGGCGKAIPGSNIRGGVAMCPSCQRASDARYAAHLLPMTGITSRRLAEVLELIFFQLKSNADIYCKYFRDDIRYQAMQKTYGEEKARMHKGMHIYPLANLLKDTSAGASVQDRIYSFLTA
jgi:hypothetical protein